MAGGRTIWQHAVIMHHCFVSVTCLSLFPLELLWPDDPCPAQVCGGETVAVVWHSVFMFIS